MLFSVIRQSRKKRTHTTGFTLVELLVVLSIIGIVTSIILFQHRSGSDQLELQRAANELALEIRRAQAYALGSYKARIDGGDTFDVGYGVHINFNEPRQIILFADAGNDRLYNNSDTVVDVLSFEGGVEITKIKYDSSPIISGLFNIVFKRPLPGLKMCRQQGSDCSTPAPTSASIFLESPQGKEIKVKVTSEGQVSVQNV